MSLDGFGVFIGHEQLVQLVDRLDGTAARNKLIDTIRQLDEQETKIMQAYAENLLSGRRK
jgi:predicted RNA-binding protein with PIN domain